jgi:hypothetical protein
MDINVVVIIHIIMGSTSTSSNKHMQRGELPQQPKMALVMVHSHPSEAP